ncbi:MAG: 7-cyano-7-deazaguanine synthase QueC [Spirochaetota bacterium]
MAEKRGIILLSGGLDSATTAAYAIEKGYSLHAITFSYGQRHDVEISFAKRIVDYLDIKLHHTIQLPLELFDKTALKKDSNLQVPQGNDISVQDEIPITYVPARNIVFLSLALAYAESHDAEVIFIGANAVDYSGYPDCRPQFISSFQNMIDNGTKTGVEGNSIIVEAPLISMKKSEIIKLGYKLGFDYSLTHSCYSPDEEGVSCGICDSCCIRRRGFKEAGIADPTRYRNG